MKLLFRIDYRANWGESLYLCGDTALLGNGDTSRALRLEVDGDRLWHAEVELPDSVAAFTYRYIIKNEQGDTKQEWGQGHCFRPAAGVNEYDIYDRWQDQPFDKPFYSAAFTECICRHNSAGTKPLLPASGYVELCVAAPMVAPGCTLAISGEGDALGNWNPDRAIRMNSAEYPIWKAKIPAAGLNAATEYKYLIVDSANGRVVSWEGGNNRSIGVEPRENAATILAGMRFINSQTPWKGAGTAIPVFSLRTESDFGVGDFYDLKEMVDWAAAAGQTFLQILPINDTTMTGTWVDSYPYKANSIYALHPMFLRLEAIGELKDKKRREYYENLRKELNALPEVDYERVNKAKAEYCREIFASDGAKTMASPEYKAFIEKNGHWLLPYAAFCVLRDRFGTPDFNKWGEYAVYSADVQAKVQVEAQTEIDFVCYQQFHLDAQMRHVHEYANSHSIALKGDIPIGISRTSADAWVDPRLFNLDCQAGALPTTSQYSARTGGCPHTTGRK